MATRAKSTASGNRSASVRQKKPATIDLEAKEVSKPDSKDATATAKKDTISQASPTAAKANKSDAKTPDTSGVSGFGRNTKGTGAQKPAEKPDTKKSEDKKQSGSGIKAIVVSSLGGAVIAIAGLGLIGQYGSAPQLPLIGSLYTDDNTKQPTGISQQLTTLENRIVALENIKGQDDANALNNRIEQLEKQVPTLQSNSPDNNNTVSETRLNEFGEQIAALDTRVNTLSETPATTVTTGDITPKLQEAVDRLANLEAEVRSLAGQEAPDISTINAEITELSDQVTRLQTTAGANTDALNRITEQSDRLDSQVQSVKASEKIARSVATNALGTTLFNGDALSIPISAIEALTGQTDETRRLSELSVNGIPSLKTLREGFDAFSKTVEQRAIQPADGGVIDQLWANVRSLISVRSSGPQEGDGTAAILSRVRQHLKDDELALASSEWNLLPDDIKSDGNEWAGQLQSRIEAFALYEKISSQMSAQTE